MAIEHVRFLSGTRRHTSSGFFSVLIIIFIALSGCNNETAPPSAPPPTLPVGQIIAGNDTTHQEYPVSIEGLFNVEIRPQVAGSLQTVFVDEGQYVNAGAPLFKINDLPYRAALNNAIASQHAAESAAANANLEIEKFTSLVQNKIVSEYQLKTAKSTYDIAKANIEQAKANVATAEINLGYTLIKAPVAGFIGRLDRKQGSLVSPSDPLALTKLSDVRNVHVYFSLGERDFVKFKEQYPGTTLNDKLSKLPPVTLLLSDNSEYNIKGKIDMIDGQFDKNTGAITLRATFTNAQGLLRAGNTGKIRLSINHRDVLSVPQTATLEQQDKFYVFELGDSNKVTKQAITIGGKDGNNYLVEDGLKTGSRIVLSGLDRLQDGMIIQPSKPTATVSVN